MPIGDPAGCDWLCRKLSPSFKSNYRWARPNRMIGSGLDHPRIALVNVIRKGQFMPQLRPIQQLSQLTA